MFFRGMVEELLWMLSGSTNVRDLQARDVHIWDEWAREDGELGPVYGAQWRHWGRTALTSIFPDPPSRVAGRDQIAELIARIRTQPDDRRLVVTAWDPDDVEAMSLPCCHILFQCWTRELKSVERERLLMDDRGTGIKDHVPEAERHQILDGFGVERRGLSLQLYQRSCDVFLGVPFNIASYALLTHMLAQVCDMVALDFIHDYGDVHIYRNHMDQVAEQLAREPRPLPRLVINRGVKEIDDFKADDFSILDYNHWPAIKAEVSV
jgi:thymidylate synthase